MRLTFSLHCRMMHMCITDVLNEKDNCLIARTPAGVVHTLTNMHTYIYILADRHPHFTHRLEFSSQRHTQSTWKVNINLTMMNSNESSKVYHRRIPSSRNLERLTIRRAFNLARSRQRRSLTKLVRTDVHPSSTNPNRRRRLF